MYNFKEGLMFNESCLLFAFLWKMTGTIWKVKEMRSGGTRKFDSGTLGKRSRSEIRNVCFQGLLIEIVRLSLWIKGALVHSCSSYPWDSIINSELRCITTYIPFVGWCGQVDVSCDITGLSIGASMMRINVVCKADPQFNYFFRFCMSMIFLSMIMC